MFSALADPTRREILARLAKGEAPVKELAEPFPLSGPAITKHLKVLEKAGLISRSREGQLRPCRMEAQTLEPALDWLEQYRSMWEESLDRLGEYLKSIGATSTSAPVEELESLPSDHFQEVPPSSETAPSKKTVRSKGTAAPKESTASKKHVQPPTKKTKSHERKK